MEFDPGQQQAPHPVAANDGLQRLHWASLLFGIGRHARALLIPAIFVLFVASKGGWGKWDMWIAVFFVPTALYELLRYATLRYRIDEDKIVVTQGLLFRSERQVPLSRIQNIDLVQNLLHRLFGVAEVRVSTAGSAEPEAVFKVLSLDAVERMRAKVFVGRGAAAVDGADDSARAVGPSATPDGLGSLGEGHARGGAASSRAPRVLLRIPTVDLIKLGLLSDRGMAIVAIGLGAAWEFGLLNRIGFSSFYRQHVASWWNWTGLLLAIAVLVVAFLGLRVLSAVWMVLRFHGYALERDGDDLRLRCGLLTRITATVPARRVQLVSVHQTRIQSWLGRLSIRIETAGGVSGSDHEGDNAMVSRRWFVPIVATGELTRLLEEIRPGLGVDLRDAAWEPTTPAARRRMMRVTLIATSIVALLALVVAWWMSSAGGLARWSPWSAAIAALTVIGIPISAWMTHREAKVRAHAVTPEGVLFRSGAWTHQTSATFFDKMQVVAMHESPFDRRHAMATLAIDTAGAGPAEHKVHVTYLPREVARRLVDEIFARTEEAGFRW